MTKEQLKEELVKLRQVYGTPISWMAIKFNVDRSTLSCFLNDIREISDEYLDKIKEGYISWKNSLRFELKL